MNNSPLRPTPIRSSLVTQVVDAWRARLSSGEAGWQVGNKLPAEYRLAEDLGVGRSTVREAVRVLANEGWLESRQGSGTFIRRNAEAPAGLLSRLRVARIAEVFEARHGFEAEAARLAALRRTEHDLTHIERCLARRSDSMSRGRTLAFVDADVDFHTAVVRASHNSVLIDLFASFTEVLTEALIDLHSNNLTSDESTRAHHLLAAAIREGDPVAAQAAARAQFHDTPDGLDSGAP